MPALVAGYESSDDESAPVASTSTSQLPKLGNGYNAAAEDDQEDDAKIEEQARADAFGLTSQQKEDIKRAEAKAVVKAAPEVLREVSRS
jgi:pre-mRNA-processing factor 17